MTDHPNHIDIVFDGPPGPEAGRFVEVEDPDRRSIRVGEWIHRDDGYWVLRIPDPRPTPPRFPDRDIDEAADRIMAERLEEGWY